MHVLSLVLATCWCRLLNTHNIGSDYRAPTLQRSYLSQGGISAISHRLSRGWHRNSAHASRDQQFRWSDCGNVRHLGLGRETTARGPVRRTSCKLWPWHHSSNISISSLMVVHLHIPAWKGRTDGAAHQPDGCLSATCLLHSQTLAVAGSFKHAHQSVFTTEIKLPTTSEGHVTNSGWRPQQTSGSTVMTTTKAHANTTTSHD